MKKRHPHKNKVLLVNITRLGDMLQATPTISGIKRENPDCETTVLVEKQFEPICHILPGIDKVVSIDLSMACRSLAAEQVGIIDAYRYVSELVDDLKERDFDYCLNMSSSAYTAMLLRLLNVSKTGGWTADEEGHRVIESHWARLFATSVHHNNRQFNSLNLVDIFRCSADVEDHPRKLMVNIEPDAQRYARSFISEAGFTNPGPLIAVQAGASQAKRQWSPERFVEMIKILDREYNARIILTGAPKELSIINPILQGCGSPNVVSAAGRTSIPQLAALLAECDVLVTGDTGPMHIAVAAGTPVVAMFLASAYGFETGPYSEGNLVLQPVIGCGPCNPNKPCSKPDCHTTISPRLMADLAAARALGEVTWVDPQKANPREVVVYRSVFDSLGFCDLKPINSNRGDSFTRHREAYRKLWLDDLGGLTLDREQSHKTAASGALKMYEPDGLDGLREIADCAERGSRLIAELKGLIIDPTAPASGLRRVSADLSELDRSIEELGFQFTPFGSLARMFVFGKENMSGSDPLSLASQMDGVYRDLGRWCSKFEHYYRDETAGKSVLRG
jgi:ADP-heptose:LPS heptosyltransferase